MILRSMESYRFVLLGVLGVVSVFSSGTIIMLSPLQLPNLSSSEAFATFPGENGKIAFISNRDGNWEIYVMNADGSGQTRLTDNSVFDGEPSWSPDGTKIAFASERPGGIVDIYVMNTDGTGITRLTTSHTNLEPY